MRLHQYPSFIEEKVILGARVFSIQDFWEQAKRAYPLDDHMENYLLLSNTRRCLLIFTGYRSGDSIYITKLVPLIDRPKIVWKRLMRLLDVKHFEVYIDPESHVEAGIVRDLGLALRGQRIEFTPHDVSKFCTRAPMVKEQENCSLEEIEEVCAMVKRQHQGYKVLLSELAHGLSSVLVRVQNNVVTSAAFITEMGDIDTVSDYMSNHPMSCQSYSQDFSEFFRYMLNRCGERKRKLRMSLAPHATVPVYEGINHEVITHSYTLP